VAKFKATTSAGPYRPSTPPTKCEIVRFRLFLQAKGCDRALRNRLQYRHLNEFVYEVFVMSIGLALLASADPVTIQQFSHALQQLSISPEVCQEVPAAIGLLKYRKFDAAIVDLQLGEQSGTILGEVRLSPSNRTAVTFAISSNDGETTAFVRKGSGFVFERPLSKESIRRILKPAFGLILRERRRYFRCPLSISVSIRRGAMPEVRCCCVNISEGGMAVSTSVPLSAGEDVQVQFTLPGHKAPFLAESKICWLKTGHLGVRFVSFSQGHKSDLQGWLSRKLEEMLPASVAGKFQPESRTEADRNPDT
jgi:PilZ domain